MNLSYTIIKADYLQRTRNYSFLITLAITVYVAYLFVPPTTASYTTLNVSGYKGAFNSAWVGYVSATMAAVMLSLYGFLLVNSGIKKDIDTEVGLIIATTPITNFGYLLTKLFSNFLILLTIVGITFAMSMLMFLVRSSGYPFIFIDFIVPYLVLAVPALFLVSGVAVLAEVFLSNRSILQFIIYFFICGAIMAAVNTPTDTATGIFDPFGLSLVTGSVKNQLNAEFHEHVKQVSFGFIFSKNKPFKIFEWNGLNLTALFILSRLMWIVLSAGLVYLSSIFFHRFDIKQSSVKKKKKTVKDLSQPEIVLPEKAPASLGQMPPLVSDYGILPFIRIELLLLIRKGPKWVWLITAGVWIAMLFTPINVAHLYLLPVIWFLQVTRWSDLATKEQTARLHYFTYASYKPLQRMLPAQILAGVILAIVLALPLIGRQLVDLNINAVIAIVFGAVFMVLFAVCLGIISGSKKLFEVLFFMITYGITQQITIIDYLGAATHSNYIAYLCVMAALILVLGLSSFLVRSYQTRNL